MATAIAGRPNTIEAPRQPTAAINGTPMIATTTVPTLPPAMWALIANPRRSVGNCSASSPLPTGCCGDPPIRDATFGTAKVTKLVANAWRANPPPNRIPPMPSRWRRDATRVRPAYVSWTIPDRKAPIAARKAMVSTLTPNSSMIATKISGRRTAWAWLMACATESSPSERIGRMSGASMVVWCRIVGLSVWANSQEPLAA